MSDLSLFLPITKVDAAQRLVYGVATAEQPDRSNEICDYATTKPHYEKWSTDIAQATQGKSFGNVRAMHGKVAAGKVTAIAFNDAQRQIEIAAKIVDDSEWAKVQEGVYTGFSQGGAYEKRWQDPDDTKLMRYTARPSEVSLVDLPCLPGATFTMVKADGAEEQIPFTSIKEYNLIDPDSPFQKGVAAHSAAAANSEISAPVISEVKETPVDGEEWAQVFQSKLDGKTFKKKADMLKHNEQLKATAVAEKAAEPAMKAIGELEAALDRQSVDQEARTTDPTEKREFSAGERKADAKSGAAQEDGSYPIENTSDLRNAIRAYGRSKNKAKTKAHIISRARALGATGMLPKGWEGSSKSSVTGDLAKDIRYLATVCGTLCDLERLKGNSLITPDAMDMLKEHCGTMELETADIIDDLLAYDGPDDLLKILIEADKTGAIAKLHGDDFAELGFPATDVEKAGARNSRQDTERLSDIRAKAEEIGKHADQLQLARELTAASGFDGGAARVPHHIEQIKVKGARIRDHAMIMLGTDGGKAEEPNGLEKLQAENAALIDKMNSMAEMMSALAATVKKIENEPMPMPGAGAVRSISKAEDNGGGPESPAFDEASIAKMYETPEGRQELFMMATKAALSKPMPIRR